MAERKSVKRKVITAVVIVGVFALLIGSFFLRDICLRAVSPSAKSVRYFR